MPHICKMEKLEIRAVIKYMCFCKPKEIHENFMETLAKESRSCNTVQKWAAEFWRARGSIEDDGQSGHPRDATTDQHVKVVYTLVMCDRSQDLQGIASKVGISFGAVHSILTNMKGMSTVLARWVL